jgi:hypothetical protein
MKKMMKMMLWVVVAGSLCMFPFSIAFGGIEPSPFYNAFPDISLLQNRVPQITARFPALSVISTEIINVRVPAIRNYGSLKPWVTDMVAKQGLGIIDHISSVLTRDEYPVAQGDAAKLMTLLDLISLKLVDPAYEPPEYAPQAFAAMGHVSRGIGWADGTIHPVFPNANSFDIMRRISAVLFAPQPEPPKVVIDGLGALDRISAVLFAPQPEPPKVISQAFDVMDRVSWVLFAPQPEPPKVASDALDIMDRISAVLFAPQPEPPRVGASRFNVMDRISAHLFAPQPEPPRVAQTLNIMERVSAVLFAPQPEPPKVLSDFGTKAISVLFQVADVTERTAYNGLSQGTIPGLNGLGQLSKNLTKAVNEGNQSWADAQLDAMSHIADKYGDY